jgi:hypothetical protein
MANEGLLADKPIAVDLGHYEVGHFIARDPGETRVAFDLRHDLEQPGRRSLREGRRPHDRPVETRVRDQRFLAILVLIALAREERKDEPVVDEAAMAPGFAGADAGDGDETAYPADRHGGNQRACGGREQCRRSRPIDAQREYDGIDAVDESSERVAIARIEFVDLGAPAEIRQLAGDPRLAPHVGAGRKQPLDDATSHRAGGTDYGNP